MLQLIDIEKFYADFDEFDLIIDARSPKEFSHSHLPHAQNLYALSDEEHEEVGTIYVRSSKHDAKVRGARYICNNASQHLQTIYDEYPLGSKIAIYCARGGLRSSSLATILSATGFRVYKIDKGYKAYRTFVLNYLNNFEHKNFIVLGGNTGCGKSELINKLTPSIDLEGLANHFGSTFGLMNGAQPTQKAFQNTLAHKLHNIEKNSWIFVEGESKKIGKIIQPDILYSRLQTGLRVEITAPLEQRVQRILKDYINIDNDYFYASMERITPYIRREAKQEAIRSYEQRDLAKVAEILLVDYYDKVYRKPNKVDFTIDNSDEKIALAQLNNIYQEATTIK